MSNANLFDFADLSDIAAIDPDLAAKVANENQDKINAVVDILKEAAAAGVEALDINQLTIVAIRKGIELPTPATVRKYLNTAVEQRLAHKPTRQTYAYGGAAATEVAEVAEVAEVSAEVNDDPLAGLLSE